MKSLNPTVGTNLNRLLLKCCLLPIINFAACHQQATQNCQISQSPQWPERTLNLRKTTGGWVQETVAGDDHLVLLNFDNGNLRSGKIRHGATELILNIDADRPRSLLLKTSSQEIILNFETNGDFSEIARVENKIVTSYKSFKQGSIVKTTTAR